MSKNAPQLYGDKITVAGDPAAPLLHVHEISEILSLLSERELAALDRFTQERLKAIGLHGGDGAENLPGNSAITGRKV
jgi:hypothetical protein